MADESNMSGGERLPMHGEKSAKHSFQKGEKRMKIWRILIFSVVIFNLLMGSCREQKSKVRETEKRAKVQRYGSLIGLKKEYEERYIILHRNVFPGVLDRIRKCNIHNYSIFLQNGVLFSYFEYTGSNYQADMAAMADDITKDWWKLTDPMQEPLKTRKQGEWWASMELLFQVDSSRAAYANAQRHAYVGELKQGAEQKFKEEVRHIDPQLIHLILDANIQNITIYAQDNRVYLYYEYVGDNYVLDLEKLRNSEPLQKMSSKLKIFMKLVSGAEPERYLQEMIQVFHTN